MPRRNRKPIPNVSFLCLSPGMHPNREGKNKTKMRLGGELMRYNEVYEVPEDVAKKWARDGLGLLQGATLPAPNLAALAPTPDRSAGLRERIAELEAELAAANEDPPDPVAIYRDSVNELRTEAGLAPVHHRLTNKGKLDAALAEAVAELAKQRAAAIADGAEEE